MNSHLVIASGNRRPRLQSGARMSDLRILAFSSDAVVS